MSASDQRDWTAVAAGVRPWFVRGFSKYVGWMLRRQFRAVRLSARGWRPVGDAQRPLVVYLNHASWWDPLIAFWLARRFLPERMHFGPIDDAQITRYGLFKWIGLFGVEKGTGAGARRFLRVAQGLLSAPESVLWLTPQGRFADVRERPVHFAPGLSHLLARLPEVHFVPLALEYGFGQERLPEIHARFGAPVLGSVLAERAGAGLEGSALPAAAAANAALEARLEALQDALRADVLGGAGTEWEVLLEGAGGTTFAYDFWRRVKGVLQGRRVQVNHAEV
jgi:1-acyl-sn-glycerol-3-phosphate acyltransferase